MFFFNRYTVLIVLCFADFGFCHPGFGLGIIFGVGGTTVIFGGVIAIAVGIVVKNICKDTIQEFTEQYLQTSLPRISLPEGGTAADEEGQENPGGTEESRITAKALEVLNTQYLRPDKGPSVSPGSPSSCTGSPEGSNTFTQQLAEESSVNTSTDDAQTIIPDKDQQQDDSRDSRDQTPIASTEDVFSHLGQAPEIERYVPEMTSSVIPSIPHRHGLSRTRSDDIDSPFNYFLAGVVNRAAKSLSDTEATHDSDHSTESTAEPPEWSSPPSETSSVNEEMEMRRQLYRQIPLDLDGSALPQVAAPAQTTSAILPSSESLSHRAQRNWRMVQVVDAIIERQRLGREGNPV